MPSIFRNPMDVTQVSMRLTALSVMSVKIRFFANLEYSLCKPQHSSKFVFEMLQRVVLDGLGNFFGYFQA